MKDDEFNKGIESIRKIKLEIKEKNSILRHVLNTPIVSPYVAPKKSSWVDVFRPQKGSRFLASISLVGILIVFLAYNAESSLPGDLLYGIKVNVSEPARDFLNLSPANKAEWESAKAIRRLDEAADLALKGKLDAKNRADIENLFNMHVDSFNSSISLSSSSTLRANFIQTEFEANVSARVQVFESLTKDLDEVESQEESLNIVIDPEEGENASTTASSTSATTTEQDVSSSTASTTSTTTPDTKQEEEIQNKLELKKLEDAVHKKLQETRNLMEKIEQAR